MSTLRNYKVNKNLNVYKAAGEIKNFINKFVNSSYTYKIIRDLSKLTNIPEAILAHDAKHILIQNYSFRLGKFKKKFQLIFIIFDSIKFITFLIFLFFFKKNINKKKTYKFMVDDIERKTQLERFSKLAKLNKSTIFIARKNFKLGNNDICNFKIKFCTFYRTYYAKCIENNKINLIIFFLNIIKYSFYTKTNLFLIFTILFYKIINYETIFSEVNAKYLIVDRFYKTSAIKDFIFKKHGGKLTACMQKILLEFSISFFIYADILFTLGTSKPKYLNNLGCKIKKYIPVGSLYLESSNAQQRKLKNFPKIDILFIGINVADSFDRLAFGRYFYNNYYKTILWLKDLSHQFPKLNIAIKHHDNYVGDPKEVLLLKGSKVKIIFKGIFGNSYDYMKNSKIVLSFGSTMILEGLSQKNKCYFLDPNFQNISFFKNMNKSKKLRIENFKELTKLIKNEIASKKKITIKSDFYCLNSDNVSRRITKYLK